jgi:photosystem II stability/assembly factor-like uncharacterized protein
MKDTKRLLQKLYRALLLFSRLGTGILLFFTTQSGYAQSSPEGGQWQGSVYPNATPLPFQPSHILLTDTGGTGGGFGRGDPHFQLNDVDFWNTKQGWACGYGGVFKTEDGGLTWTRMKPIGQWTHVRIARPHDIWLTEDTQPGRVHLWHSLDDGRTWVEALPDTLRGDLALYCKDGQCWILGGTQSSYYSTDDGKTWKPVNVHGLLDSLDDLTIPADVRTDHGFTVYLLGTYHQTPRLIKSLDGGNTWTALRFPTGTPPLFWRPALFFTTTWQGWVSFQHDKILYTDDGGQSWQERDLPISDQDVLALWFDQEGHGFAAVLNSPAFGSLRDPYVGAYRTALFETWDGGKTWIPALRGQKQINSICSVGPDIVWMVGLTPTVIPNDLVAIWQRGYLSG